MTEGKFNTIAIISLCFAVIAFGGSVVQSYVGLSERLARNEAQLQRLTESLELQRRSVDDMRDEIRGYNRVKVTHP